MVETELWQRAQDNLSHRKPNRVGRSPNIGAMCRRRIFCPICNLSMTTRADAQVKKYPNLKYYVCTSRHRQDLDYCGMRQIQINWLDQIVWERISASLKDPALIELQLQRKWLPESDLDFQQAVSRWNSIIEQSQRAIEKIQRAYEVGMSLYIEDEVVRKVHDLRTRIAEAMEERNKLEVVTKKMSSDRDRIAQLRKSLEALHADNLDNASFEEKCELMDLLDIRVYPSNDLTTITLTCALDVEGIAQEYRVKSATSRPQTNKTDTLLASLLHTRP